ncbi:MAG: hypothetical protein ACE5DM_05545 [Candidatus Nanoarchaeia archaeon]
MKKAQAAMEFLMTYGWAILVVLAAIGAMSYFGVFTPTDLLPEHCALTAGVACEDYIVYPGGATFLIRNGLSGKIVIDRVVLGDCSESLSVDVPFGRAALVNLTGCNFSASGTAFKEDLEVVFTEHNSGFQKTVKGSVTAHIQ